MYLFLGSRSPLVRFGVFRVGAVHRLSFRGVLLMSSFSLCALSSVSWSSSEFVVSRLGWCSSSRSILLWVRGSAVPLACRGGSASPSVVAGLVGFLRASRASGALVRLGVRSGWSGSRWFCAARPVLSPVASPVSAPVVEGWRAAAEAAPRRRLPAGLAAGLAAIHARSISKRYADAE